MLTRSALIVAVLFCASAFGAVFDPYSRRYDICKNSMNDLLVTPPGKSRCTYVQGLYDCTTKAALTVEQNTTFTQWINSVETSIILNASYATSQEKFIAISGEMQKFQMEQSAIYTKVQYLNISTWGPVDTVVKVSAEWNFESSLELVLPTSVQGNCKLFDLLLEACDDDVPKKTALKSFIDSRLKAIVADKTKTETQLIVEINKALTTEFFVGGQASWKAYFFGKKLKGHYRFSQWTESAITFQRKTDITVTLTGQGMDCPFILSLNATLSSTAYTNTQKGFIKQLMNFFIQQWTTVTTIEERQLIISKKFSESIDLSYSYFSCLNSIEIIGFGGKWWDLIIFGCQKQTVPVNCGCTHPPVIDEDATTTAMVAETTTEMAPTTTAEASTTEATTEAVSSSTDASSASTWDSTFSTITFPASTDGCSCTCEY